MIDIKMSTVVLVLNQDGITELIQTANDLQTKVDAVMSTGDDKKKDRIADAGASNNLLDAAKEKLPIIMEEDGGENEEEMKAVSTLSASTSSSK